MTMTLVSTVTVGAGGAASISFTGIPQTGQDLYVVFSLRANSNTLNIRLNSDAGSNYVYRSLRGDGTTASSVTSTTTAIQAIILSSTAYTANTFGNGALYLPNYTGATAKSASVDGVSENNATAAFSELVAGSWTGTAAITAVSLNATVSLEQYSTASLYTISTTGATGATVA